MASFSSRLQQLIKDKKKSIAVERKRSQDDGDDDGDGDNSEMVDLASGGKNLDYFSEKSIDSAVHSQSDQERDDEGEDEEEEEEKDVDPISRLPSKFEFTLPHGDKPVSAIGVDSSGSRLVTGCHAYQMKMWDFNSMHSSPAAFRTLQPIEGHHLKQLQFSPGGSEQILVIAGNAQAKVLDRDGVVQFECSKGYQYIVNTTSTKGHTGMLNDGAWHPTTSEVFATCSVDGSVRLWNVRKRGQTHTRCIKVRGQGGKRAVPTSFAFCIGGHGGSFEPLMVVGTQDGLLQIWDTRTTLVQANAIAEAHPGNDITRVSVSYDSLCVATRSTDDSIKLWDLRNIKKPTAFAFDLPNRFPETDVRFSPDNRMVVACVSDVPEHSGVPASNGNLVFFERSRTSEDGELEPVLKLDVSGPQDESNCGAIRCVWHPRLNQIFASTTTGAVRIFYDPEKSYNGALLCATKQLSRSRQQQMYTVPKIITPYTSDMWKEDREMSHKWLRRETRKHKAERRINEPRVPESGLDQVTSQLGSKGSSLSKYVVQQIVQKIPDLRDDPRRAILRHAEAAETDPYWVNPAYKKTQPKPVFDLSKDDNDDAAKDNSSSSFGLGKHIKRLKED